MRSIEQMVHEQVKRWEIQHRESASAAAPAAVVITVSRQPGSGGRLVAQAVSERLGFDLFHQEMIHEMAQSANVSEKVAQSLDERRLSVLEDYLAALVNREHLWPDVYLRHLLKVVGTIGKHGRAVIVGRGAHLILPPEGRLRVRIIAPRAHRARMVAEQFGLSFEEAENRVIKTGSERKAFIRKYFNADIDDPLNYDLVLNTATLGIAEAARTVVAAVSAPA